MNRPPLSKVDFLASKNALAKMPTTAVEVELPVKGGRSSVPDHNGLYTALFGDMALISPDFNVQILDLMEYLGKFNADVSYALDNIVQLGNTEYEIGFDDGVSQEQAAQMILHLKQVGKKWYSNSGGVNSLINDLLAQIGLTGALSAEGVPKDDLSGIKKVVLVSPKNIEFMYNREKDEYEEYQKNIHAASAGVFDGGIGRIKLNPVTYKYYAIRRFNEKPYAIPPFMSALENLNIEKDMMGNFKHIVKQLGVFGFLQVLMTAPTKLSPQQNGGVPETDVQYQTRLQAYLNSQASEVKKSLAEGFVMGYKGSHEFDMKGNLSNPQGAKQLFDMNTEMKMAGLKQDPLMLGRNYNTTETLGRVIITKLTSQLTSYQKLVATFLEEVFMMELLLAGFKVQNIEVEFTPPMLADQVKEQTAFGLKIKNYNDLYNQGIIDQQQRSQALGWETPAEEEPRFGGDLMQNGQNGGQPNGGGQPNPNKNATINNDSVDAFSFFLGGKVTEFDYFAGDNCGHDGCGHNHTHNEELNFSLSDKEAEAILKKYLNESTKNYSATVKKAVSIIGKRLLNLGANVSLETVLNNVFFSLYNEIGGTFSTRQKGIIEKWITRAYTAFRKDPTPFVGKDGIPAATFGLKDWRTMNYFKNSDSLYMGKFITDADTTKKIQEFINEHYFEKGDLHLGKNPQAIKLFNEKFGDLLKGEDWKIQRILSTTVNTMKSYASIAYLEQGEIQEFEIRGVNDRLQCPFCAEMQGKRFSVAKASTIVTQVTGTDPADVRTVKPFLSSAYKTVDDLKNATREDIEAKGAFIPSFHPACRDRLVAVL